MKSPKKSRLSAGFYLKNPGFFGWVFGFANPDENPVVSLDLDLDFGLYLRLCQKVEKNYFDFLFSSQKFIFLAEIINPIQT